MDHAAATQSGERSFRFAAAKAPARDRMPIQDLIERGIWRFDFEPSPDAPFFVDGRMQSLPGLVLSDIATSEGRTQRTAQHLVDDQFLFNVCLGGASAVSQCGRDIVIEDGDAILTMGAEKAAMSFSASRFLSFRLSAKALTALVPDVEDRVARPVGRDTAALKLLLGYANTLSDAHVRAAPQLRQLAVTHVYDLIALALGVAGDTGQLTKARGMRAARLNAIKADIEDNLCREDLSAAALAARHRLPLRYVRRLFEEDGITFTEFVLERRLARAHRMLVNPRLAHQKISNVAIEAGFNNLSYFNQAFRRRFGATPSDLRAQAQRPN